MFKKEKCAGCRKDKYFVKYREVFIPGANVTAKSMDKLCFSCGRRLKKFKKQKHG